MRQGAILSAILHVLLILLLVFGLPRLTTEPEFVPPIPIEVVVFEDAEPEPEPAPPPEPEPEEIIEEQPQPEPEQVASVPPPPPEPERGDRKHGGLHPGRPHRRAAHRARGEKRERRKQLSRCAKARSSPQFCTSF